jgi:RNA polymerase sigma-70 factor (ECF subfamily)
MTDNSELIARLRQHNADALAEFLTVNQRPLLAFIDRQVGVALRRKIEIEDVFQEVSAEALRALPEADLTDRDPFGWLCQIAERRIIDAHRHHFGAQKRDAGREVPLGSAGGDTQHAAIIDLLVASMTSASQIVSRNAREVKLYSGLASLPEDQREALRLRYLEGLPSKEIAARLGKTDGAVRVMLTRALGKLQQILGPDVAPR